MDNKLVVLCVCLAFVGFASATIKCYSCDKNSCAQDKSKWTVIEDCGKAQATNIVGSCSKMVYKDKATGNEYTHRKCVLAEKDAKGEISYKCNPLVTGDEIKVCEHCESDLCNSAPVVNFSLFALLGVAMAYLVPTYLMQ